MTTDEINKQLETINRYIETLKRKIDDYVNIINAFKRYDAKRKVYYKRIIEDLDVYSGKYLALKKILLTCNPDDPLDKKYLALKTSYIGLQQAYERIKKKLELVTDKDKLERAEALVKNLKEYKDAQNLNELSTSLKRMREDNSNLIYTICQLKNKLKEYEDKSKTAE